MDSKGRSGIGTSAGVGSTAEAARAEGGSAEEDGGDEEDRTDAEEGGERPACEGADGRSEHLGAGQQREGAGGAARVSRLAGERVGGRRDGGAEGAEAE